LSIDANALFRIRQARLQSLGMPPDTAYGVRDHIHKEIDYARQVFESNPQWPMLDVTDRAIEETAAELLALRKHRAARRARG
jgi:[pyruvate, water dikinase]-phosphate phosphotransferase / [pyruvate, water dikinase] kinase